MPTRTDTNIVYAPNGTIISQTSVDVVVPYKALTRAEFLELFTNQEITDAIALKATTLKVWWEKFNARTEFRRDAPLTGPALDALTATGVLAAGRKAEILNGWPT
jgi:hypothetical protein